MDKPTSFNSEYSFLIDIIQRSSFLMRFLPVPWTHQWWIEGMTDRRPRCTSGRRDSRSDPWRTWARTLPARLWSTSVAQAGCSQGPSGSRDSRTSGEREAEHSYGAKKGKKVKSIKIPYCTYHGKNSKTRVNFTIADFLLTKSYKNCTQRKGPLLSNFKILIYA